jgi:hypothetical protein
MRGFSFAVGALFLILAGCTHTTPCEKEIYLVPKGFHGKIMIFFDRQDGQKKSYEGEARFFTVPPGGLMKSQFPKNGGCMNDRRLQFFSVDSLGNRLPLLYFLDMQGKQIPADSTYVVFSLLSNKGSRNPFVIHLVGSALEFAELTREVKRHKPEEILDSLK